MDTQCSLSWDSTKARAINLAADLSVGAKRSLNGAAARADEEERCVFDTRTTEA